MTSELKNTLQVLGNVHTNLDLDRNQDWDH